MIDDPYKILGVAPGASQEEIKTAYRKKIKEYHPDLHPNDPSATRKTNEVNEAYNILQNPEKYEAQRQQSRSTYGADGPQRSSHGYQGPGGWSSDFSGFNFDDFFGFGFGSTQTHATIRPETMPGDSREIQYVVSAINSGRYHDAVHALTQIPSRYRNARWYYLSSLAYHGTADNTTSIEHMRKAAQMDPNNRTYIQLYQQFSRQEQTRNTEKANYTEFHMPVINIGKIFIGLFVAQFIFSLLHIIFGMGAHVYYLPG